MRITNYILICCLFGISAVLQATEFTISSYNCGGLSDHYDYLRAASMQKLMKERYAAEPEEMVLNEKIQKLALKILFSKDADEKTFAQQEWEQKEYDHIFQNLTRAPTDPNSPNAIWNQKSGDIISSYKVRPITIFDEEVNQMLTEHLRTLTRNESGDIFSLVEQARAIMAKRIFTDHMKYDIICLQEADYLDVSMFPNHFEVLMAETAHSKNGIAWNKNRFDLVDVIGDIKGRAFAVQLLDIETTKTILIASGHITGCNPYRIEENVESGESDALKGDNEVRTIVQLFEEHKADLRLIGMDSNVTSLHPRLNIVKEAGYELDYENVLEVTCTNPNQVLNTRIDWIVMKSDELEASITNIPIQDIGLNNLQTNMSDHKPVAAKVEY